MLATLAASLAGSPCQEPARMIHILGGEFWMGSDEAERAFAYRISSPAVRRARWFDAELTLQKVAVLDFCIDRLLVTQADYARFVAATGHRAPGISRFSRGIRPVKRPRFPLRPLFGLR